MKIVKRSGAVLIGFAFLVIFHLSDNIFNDFELQMILKWVRIIGAITSFIVSVLTDKKIRFNQLVKNKWIIFSVILSVIVLIVLVVLML